ncbi:MAG: hypothetical protein MUF30_04470 [Burkholderiales bacterium]|nr:hypothetical protein [Burkholderiales bacterium]
MFGRARAARSSAPAPALRPVDAFALTVVTPTTGKASLEALIASMDAQQGAPGILHLLLWDEVRDASAVDPRSYDGPTRRSLECPWGLGRNGDAPGSPLRAVGLMAAPTPWVTFADDDVRWAPDHVAALLAAAGSGQWASTLRAVEAPDGTPLGVDRFESVGDDPQRRTPWEMVDNNCLLFRREWGVAAAAQYRETRAYDDDRRMYALLKAQAGPRGRTGRPTLVHTCPERLVPFFREFCSPD